jgi:hypothetical protein
MQPRIIVYNPGWHFGLALAMNDPSFPLPIH